MASRFPRDYGGDGLAEQPKIHHSNLNIRSTHEEPFVIHCIPLPSNMLLTIKDKTFSILKTIMEGSNQIVRYVYYPYYPNYLHEEEDQLVTKQLKQSKSVTYEPKVIKEYVNEKKNLFKILQNCYTVANNELGLIAVKFNWKERHLKLEQGLNLLADCKNCDCEHFMQGVVCPRGMFRDRNGYCPLDMELYKAKCPTCKQKISPDESFGFGFYNCDFQITYKLFQQKEYRMRQEGSGNIFYFRKLSVLANLFEYLEAQISICTFV
eukprot:TRINITY_DN4297_c0_g1_i6.p1 TRINITY_DN4297_c0_g1~~TRINITY_DN4297_c0_g1_i6.p1  ORF type:complete len:277 (-),score=29.99 TRINITY_DN4297_c0_g1_i6:161-955(-)